MPARHVLIIGGGLAGPCLALSLTRHNIRSTIFEIRATRSEAGGSISLGPNALQVLDRHAGVYDRIKSAGFTYTRFNAYSDDGEKFGQIAVGEETDHGYPAVRIMRSRLHEILLEATKESGMIDVKWGAKLDKITEGKERVTAYFEDGTSAEGDILVGADGIHSKVREHILGASSPTPSFDGLCIVYGFVPASAAIAPTPEFSFPAFMFTPSGLLMTIPIDANGKTLAWVINKPVDKKSREEWKEFERSGEAARLAKSDYDAVRTEPVRSLLDKADDKNARLWPTYSIPDVKTWHTARVCLIGDAAHALPPHGAQGSAMAFEDAAILTRLLAADQTSDYDKLFSRFEAIRRPRIAALRKSSKTGAAIKTETGPWLWYVKKWAFRAFFWWSRGLVQHKEETTYDVDKVEL